MNLSTVELASYVAAGCLAGSKLLSVTKPLWDKLPRVVAVALPAVVAALPLLAEKAGLVQTTGDLVTLCAYAVALTLPGAAEATSKS